MANQKKELAYGKVYQAIRNMIALRRFEPGFSLNVEKLSRELGVSRTPVWEAMRRLEQEGVVETIPNRGVFMARISLETTIDIMEVRGSLDMLAGKLACKRMKKSTLDRLGRCLSDQLQAIEADDIAAYFLADNHFHRIIYEASGNTYLAELYESITLKMLPIPYPIQILVSSLHQTSIYMTHQQIVDGFTKGNIDDVEKAFAHHTELIIKHLNEKIQSDMDRKEEVKELKRKLPPKLKNQKRSRSKKNKKEGNGQTKK